MASSITASYVTDSIEVKQWTLEDLARLSGEVKDSVSLVCFTWADFKYGSGCAPDAMPEKAPSNERLEYVGNSLTETCRRLQDLAEDIRRRV